MANYKEYAEPYVEAARRFRGMPAKEGVLGAPAALYLLEERWKAHTEKVRVAIEAGDPPPPPPPPPTPIKIINDIETAVDRMRRRRREPSRSGRIRKLLPDMEP